MRQFSDYPSFLGHLDELGLFHMDLTLDRMSGFLARLGGPPRFSVAHVVGTNGKGSTAALLERLAREHGLRTGLYSSPHFLTPRERVLVDGNMLSEEQWLGLANRVAEIGRGLDLTYFEFLTCLAVLAFEEAGVDLAVMEAGLGGRYDATRVLDPALVLFTPVGLDHTAQLGPDLASIADDKSRALPPGGLGVTAPQDEAAMAVLRRRAQDVDARLDVAAPLAPGRVAMPGAHQRVNAGLALAGWRLLAERFGVEPDPGAEARALTNVRVPGRFQIAEGRPRLILDGAHNPHGLAALRACLEESGERPDAVVFACMADKPVEEMARAVRALCPGPLLLPDIPGVDRLMPPAELARLAGGNAQPFPDLAAALERAGDGTVLVCGSLYLLAEVYRLCPGAWSGSGQ